MNVVLKVRGFDNAVKVVNALSVFGASLKSADTPNGACQVRVSRWKGADDACLEFARSAVPGARIHLPNVGLKVAKVLLYIVLQLGEPEEAYFLRRQSAEAFARKNGGLLIVRELQP